jgi:serine/threonine protein kinase
VTPPSSDTRQSLSVTHLSVFNSVNPRDVSVDFKNFLGGGSFAAVYCGKLREKDVAVKIMQLRSRSFKELQLEARISMHEQLRHPNIIHTYGAYCTTEFVGLVLERCVNSLAGIIER